MLISLWELRRAIWDSWCRETSIDPEGWSEDKPGWGQSPATALIVNDYLHGKIMKIVVDGVTHYYNILPSGQLSDLSYAELFGLDLDNKSKPVEQKRMYLTRDENIRMRYQILKQQVSARLSLE